MSGTNADVIATRTYCTERGGFALRFATKTHAADGRPLTYEGRCAFASGVKVRQSPWKDSPLISLGFNEPPANLMKPTDMITIEDMDDDAVPQVGDNRENQCAVGEGQKSAGGTNTDYEETGEGDEDEGGKVGGRRRRARQQEERKMMNIKRLRGQRGTGRRWGEKRSWAGSRGAFAAMLGPSSHCQGCLLGPWGPFSLGRHCRP